MFKKQQIYSWIFLVQMFFRPNNSFNILEYSGNCMKLISDSANGRQNNLKNQTIRPTFLKSDDGKSCLIPDIIQYSLTES